MTGAAQVPCSRCGDFLDPSVADYSEDGDLVCAKCNAVAQIDLGEERAARGIFASAGGSVSVGVIALFFNPCLIFTIMGVLSAVTTFGLLYRHPEYRRRLGWKLPVTIGVALVGLMLSAGAPFLRVILGVLFNVRTGVI